MMLVSPLPLMLVSICLSFSKIPQNVVGRFGLHFQRKLEICQGINDYILGLIMYGDPVNRNVGQWGCEVLREGLVHFLIFTSRSTV